MSSKQNQLYERPSRVPSSSIFSSTHTMAKDNLCILQFLKIEDVIDPQSTIHTSFNLFVVLIDLV